MNLHTSPPLDDDDSPGFAEDFEPREVLPGIGKRDSRRTGPGSAARRALEALAESRRLNRELADLDSYEEEGTE